MVLPRALFVAVLGSGLAAAGPAEAAPQGRFGGWFGWLARTMAEALVAVGGGDAEPDLNSGGNLLLDRGISTVSSGFQRVAPALDRFDVDVGLDRQTHPTYGLALTQPLVHREGRTLDLASRVGYQPSGTTHQAVALSYREGDRRSARFVPTRVVVELERDQLPVSDRARHAVAAELAWTGLQVGGGVHADPPSAGPTGAGGLRIDGAHAHLVASLPHIPWAEIETRGRWATAAADPARLAISEATYLVRACPFGPLELTAGRRDDGSPEPDWFTRLQLKLELGGGP